ncbi:MAG: hypothetical protein ABIH92_01520 [Nanoarchaeota archaeon]
MKRFSIFLGVFLILLVLPLVSAAHYVVGYVNDAADGEPANGKTVVLWNPTNGINDNLTDTVGPSGSSGVDNIYLIDCELLNTPCGVGDEMRTQVFDGGDGYLSISFANITVTGAGFDIMPNMTLNSPPSVVSVKVDDSLESPVGEIDLTPAATTNVVCEGVVYEYDGENSLINVTAEFFDNAVSSYGSTDDNNDHYQNNSCDLNVSYGDSNDVYFNCSFQVEYYANSGSWNCTVRAEDNPSTFGYGNNLTNINSLLALSIPSPIDFGVVNVAAVGPEEQVNVTNVGNVEINLSLSGYGATLNDGLAMNCSLGENISEGYTKYNLTASNPGDLTLSQFESLYLNLTSNVLIRRFDLSYRHNDTAMYLDDTNFTYWRTYVPGGVLGDCSGNIVFGAVQSGGS